MTDGEWFAGAVGPPTAPARARVRGSIAATAGWAFAIYAASAAMRFGFQVGYARMLGVVDFGRLAYALGWALLLAPVSTLGYSSTVLALVPVYGAGEQWAYLRGLIRRARQLTVCVGLGISTIAAVFVLGTVEGPSQAPLIVGFALVPVLGLLLLHQELLRALRRPLVGYSLALLAQPAIAMGLTGVVYLVVDGLTAAQALLAYGVSGAAIVGVEWVLVVRIQGRERVATEPDYDKRRWTTTSRGLFVASMFQRVIYQADLVLVGIMLGPREAGLYAAASRVAGIGSLIAEAVNSIVAPEIAHHHAAGDRASLQETVDAGVRLTFWPALAAFLVTMLLAGPLLSLFGKPFSAAAWVLIFLAIGGLVNAATGPCGYLLSLTGHQAMSARIAGLHAVANLAVAAILIPALGRNGAALASALVFASFNVTIAVTVKRHLGIASYRAARTKGDGYCQRDVRAAAKVTMGISGGAVHAGVVGLAVLILSLAVLRKVEPLTGDRTVARIVRFALVLKLIAAPLQLYFVNRVYENVADYNLYHAVGSELAAPYRGGDFQVELPHKIIGLGIIYIVTGLVYAVIGVSKTGGALVFSCIGFWGLYLFYRAARFAVPEVDASRYAKLLFLLPSMLFWSSTIGKDALMCFALGVSAVGAARVLTRQRLGFVTLAMGMAATAVIRPHVTLMFVLALGIAYVIRPTSGRSLVEPLLKGFGIAVLLVGGVALGNQVEEYLGIPDLRPETIGTTLDQTALETGEESPFGGENDEGYRSSFDSDGLRSPLALPGAVVTVLFRPFAFEAHNGPSMLASIEGAILMVLVLTSLGRLRYAVSVWRRRPYVSLAVVYVLVFCFLFASAVENFGILARQRVQVLPFMLLLVALPARSPSKARRPVHSARPRR